MHQRQCSPITVGSKHWARELHLFGGADLVAPNGPRVASETREML